MIKLRLILEILKEKGFIRDVTNISYYASIKLQSTLNFLLLKVP